MSKRFSYKFAVGQERGLRSGVWSITAKKNDIYIAGQTFGGCMKISIHDGKYRHEAFTSEYMREQQTKGIWTLPTRVLTSWEGGIQLSPTLTAEYCLLFAQPQLRAFDTENSKVTFIEVPTNQLLVINVLIQSGTIDEKCPGQDGASKAEGLKYHDLRNGTRLWITKHIEEIPDFLKQPELGSFLQVVKQQYFSQISELPNQFCPEHRLSVALPLQNGIRSTVELAADSLNI